MEDRWSAERPALDADALQEMIDRDQALLDNVDEMVMALKSATQAHKDALTSALSIADEDARGQAVEYEHQLDRLYLALMNPKDRVAELQHRLDVHFAAEAERFFTAPVIPGPQGMELERRAA